MAYLKSVPSRVSSWDEGLARSRARSADESRCPEPRALQHDGQGLVRDGNHPHIADEFQQLPLSVCDPRFGSCPFRCYFQASSIMPERTRFGTAFAIAIRSLPAGVPSSQAWNHNLDAQVKKTT